MPDQKLQRLAPATLHLATNAALPGYDRSKVTRGIVHIGVGAFHRAHQAVYVDDCIAAGEAEWGIVGASLRSTGTRDALAPQGRLYALWVEDGGENRPRIIGSLLDVLVAPENPAALVEQMADAATRIVTLTVTEKAYLRSGAGDLDLANADVQWDVANPDSPRTIYGFLHAALKRRRDAGTPPFTVLCCDNLPANGETVKRLFLQFVGENSQEFARWAEAEVAFPSTMVDRIVPATTTEDRDRISQAIGLRDAWPVKTEPFMQWVVEDHFPFGRPSWERFGVTMVEDVRPYEEMKLRLLNGAHSGMAYAGLLLGSSSISEAFGDELIRGFVERIWGEAVPTLPAGAALDTAAYTVRLAERFSNTALVHRTAQISMDGSQKLPQRVIATARTRLAEGAPFSNMMLVAAAWIACCQARGRTLPRDEFTDPLDAKLAQIFADDPDAAETVRRVFGAAGFDTVAGEAASAMHAEAAALLATIRAEGMRAAIAQAAKAGEAA